MKSLKYYLRKPRNKNKKVNNEYFDIEFEELDISLMNFTFLRNRYRTKEIVDEYYDLWADKKLMKSWKEKSKSKYQFKQSL